MHQPQSAKIHTIKIMTPLGEVKTVRHASESLEYVKAILRVDYGCEILSASSWEPVDEPALIN